jgi:hypothetical protein
MFWVFAINFFFGFPLIVCALHYYLPKVSLSLYLSHILFLGAVSSAAAPGFKLRIKDKL